MKEVVLIRHGEFDKGQSHLNKFGKQQILALASQFIGTTPTVFSSTGPRSQESAHIFAEILGTTYEANEIFGDEFGKDQAKYYDKAIDKLRDIEGVVVIISKGEYLDDFAPYIAKNNFDIIVKPYAFERGHGVVLTKKGIKELPSL